MVDQFPKITALPHAELLSLQEFWPTIVAWFPRSTEWGTANATYFLGDRQQYVLKIYSDGNARQRVFEHELLLSISNAPLSFAIPIPLRVATGNTLVQIGTERNPLQAAVYQVIPGNSAPRGDGPRLVQIGKTLGELHRTLGASKIPEVNAVLPPWGDLDRIHPLVPNSREVMHELGAPSDVVFKTQNIMTNVGRAMTRLQLILPSQFVHADYVQPNILFVGENVSGVIDFEFATYDLRAFDLVASLYHFCLSPWSDVPRWNLIESFVSGYLSYVRLTSGEIDSLPMLLRWQRLSCVVYWTGLDWSVPSTASNSSKRD